MLVVGLEKLEKHQTKTKLVPSNELRRSSLVTVIILTTHSLHTNRRLCLPRESVEEKAHSIDSLPGSENKETCH
jgi:hypothetical protein